MKVAVVGAGGFVGSRLVERWSAVGPHVPVPVVRHAGSLARVARFACEWRIADARSEESMEQALVGCDAVVQCMVAEGGSILAAVAPTFRAAARAGVKRMVYLSSAAVHGLDPEPGTHELTPLPDGQGVDYNDSRVSAELRLAHLAEEGGPKVVILRPSIVYGPRSRWVTDPFEDLLGNRGAWVRGGAGFCNAIHVDNLVHAIERGLAAGDACFGKAYLVRDASVVTWREFLLPLAAAAGRSEADFHQIPPLAFEAAVHHPGIFERVKKLLNRTGVNRHVPWRVKAAVKGAVSGWSRTGAQTGEGAGVPGLAPEVNLLHQCRWIMPIEAAVRDLGYAPALDTKEGLRRAILWLRWAGYPVEGV